jgi:biofilm PGA synthesis N-glycosyltransferase PgaC
MLVEIVRIVMWLSFAGIFFFYACYLLLLFYLNKRPTKNVKTGSYIYPTVSMVVPVHNEEKIIANKIQNIEELVYPNDRIEVVFVDGHSTDNTPRIIEDHVRKCEKSIRLIRQGERNGYTGGIAEGILNSKGEVIFATDAASYHFPDSLMLLIRHFADPQIGAVTGKEVVLGLDRRIGPQLEKSYRVFYDFMRAADTNMDSTPDTKGEILVVRKEICTNLIPTLSKSPNASFDSCVPYQAKLMGYRTIYDGQARYYEYAPASFSDRFRQQIRRATVLIGAMFLFKGIFFRKKLGKFGLIILPIHFVMDVILPYLFIVGVFGFILSTILDPIAVLPLWVLVAFLLLASHRTRHFILAFVQAQFALLIASFRLVGRRKSLYIDSIQSTRT